MMDKLTNRLEQMDLIRRENDGHTRILPGRLKKLGAAVGSRFGPIGSAVGSAAGSAIARITGHGEYTVHGNSLIDSGGNLQAQFMNKDGALRVCHREYLFNVMASSSFEGTRLPINPGMLTSFPSLARVAQNYTSYRFEGLVFEFRSTSGPVATTTPSSGTVICATQYNPTEAPFGTKVQMDGYLFSTSAKPYESFLHPVECDPRESFSNSWLVRHGPLGVSTSNLPFYDMGNFSVATDGCDVSNGDYVVGEIWVTYDCTLMKPKIPPLFYNNFSSRIYGHTGTASSQLFLDAPAGTLSDLASWGYTVAGASGAARVHFTQVGEYHMSLDIHGGTSVDGIAVATTGDVALTVEHGNVNGAQTQETFTYVFVVDSVSKDSNYVTFTAGGSWTNYEFVISQLSGPMGFLPMETF
jgi:hypothetical protein